jgi:hypothetical protein
MQAWFCRFFARLQVRTRRLDARLHVQYGGDRVDIYSICADLHLTFIRFRRRLWFVTAANLSDGDVFEKRHLDLDTVNKVMWTLFNDYAHTSSLLPEVPLSVAEVDLDV